MWSFQVIYSAAVSAAQLSFWLSFALFIPLSLLRPTRSISAICLQVAAYVFGFAVWLAGAAIAYEFWGIWAVLVGLFILGVGVVPVAILAAAVHGSWSEAGVLIFGLALVAAARFYSVFLFSVTRTQPVHVPRYILLIAYSYAALVIILVLYVYCFILRHYGVAYLNPSYGQFNVLAGSAMTVLALLPTLILVKASEYLGRRKRAHI